MMTHEFFDYTVANLPTDATKEHLFQCGVNAVNQFEAIQAAFRLLHTRKILNFLMENPEGYGVDEFFNFFNTEVSRSSVQRSLQACIEANIVVKRKCKGRTKDITLYFVTSEWHAIAHMFLK